MTHPRFTAKPLSSAAEIDDILKLRQEVFNEPGYGLARWRWQYEENPQGEPCIWLAVDEKEGAGAPKLAGHYAMIAYNLRVNEQTVSVCQSLDTFTSSDYRNQGIFVRLAEEAYREATGRKVRAVIGFPNQNSLPGFIKKLAFKDPFALHHYQRPLKLGFFTKRIPGAHKFPWADVFGMISLVVRPRLGKDETFVPIAQLPPDFEALVSGFEKQFPIMIVRSRAYMNWRYFGCTDRDYCCFELRRSGRLAGVAVIRVADGVSRTGQIIDLITGEPGDRKPLLAHALSKLESMGAESAVTYFQEGSALAPVFLRAGFVRRGAATRFILRILESSELQAELLQLSDPTRWYLCAGDTDFF